MTQPATPFGPDHPEIAPNKARREQLRNMSSEERGKLVSMACKAAAKILAGRRASGLPDPKPTPWPASTWEFLKKAAQNDRSHRDD